VASITRPAGWRLVGPRRGRILEFSCLETELLVEVLATASVNLLFRRRVESASGSPTQQAACAGCEILGGGDA